jgi:hypothetical protein
LPKPTTTGSPTFKAALDPVGAQPDFATVGIGVIDFTDDPQHPSVWLSNPHPDKPNADRPYRIGSASKIAVILAAVQLRLIPWLSAVRPRARRRRDGGSAEQALTQTEAAGPTLPTHHLRRLRLRRASLPRSIAVGPLLDARPEPGLQLDGGRRVRDRAQDVDPLEILLCDQEPGQLAERFDVRGEQLERVLVRGVNELLDDSVDEAERFL